MEMTQTGGNQPSFPFQAREARAFPPAPSGEGVARALLPAYLFPRRRTQGMPTGRGGRKPNHIIDGQSGRHQQSGDRATNSSSLRNLHEVHPSVLGPAIFAAVVSNGLGLPPALGFQA